VETPVEATVETVVETTVHTPVEATIEAPVETTVAPAVETTVEPPVEPAVEPVVLSSPAAAVEQEEPAESAAVSQLAATGLDGELAARISGVEFRRARRFGTQLRTASQETLLVGRELAAGRLADPDPQAAERPEAAARTSGQLATLDPRAVDDLDLPTIAGDEATRIPDLAHFAADHPPSVRQLSPQRGQRGGEAAVDAIFAGEGG